MKFKKTGSAYIIRLQKGEGIIASLLDFCKKESISAGYFSGIGACSHAELGHFSLDTKQYSPKILDGQYEIASLHGNITSMGSAPYVHAHITLGDSRFSAIAGHLKEATVSATCEIILVKLGGEIKREKDEETGLNLLDI